MFEFFHFFLRNSTCNYTKLLSDSMSYSRYSGHGSYIQLKGQKKKRTKGELLLKKHKGRGFLVVCEGKGCNYRTLYRYRICHEWVNLPPSFHMHFYCFCNICYHFFAEIKYIWTNR